MFTGLIEAVGTILNVQRSGGDIRLTLSAPFSREVKPGDSVSVNGVCLTAVETGEHLVFDLVEETVRRTSLSSASAGSRVNLERALAAGARLGGHFVQGHVDGTLRLLERRSAGEALVLQFAVPPPLQRYLVEKGSAAVDGISLTVAALTPDGFEVWIVPHTLQNTTLGDKKVGDCLNLEVDILAKYTERLLTVGTRCAEGDGHAT